MAHDGIWLWLDDCRPMPAEFDQCVQNRDDAIKVLATGKVTRVSLDHDLGKEAIVGDGYRVACWIEDAAYSGDIPRLAWTVHSQNPVGAMRMREALRNADLFWSQRDELAALEAESPARPE